MVLIIDHFKEKSALFFFARTRKSALPAPLCPKIIAGALRVIPLVAIATKPGTGWLDFFFTEMFLQ